MTDVNDGGSEAPEMVLPFYLLCDESHSLMQYIGAINSELAELKMQVVADPVVADKAHFGIVAVSSDAATILPLSDLDKVQEIPLLSASGITNYRAAFDHIKEQITHDVERLRQGGTRVYRPSVFFISDGEPTSNHPWEAAYEALISDSFKYRPNIISFGVGDANKKIIARVGTLAAYQAKRGMDVAAALRQFAHALTRSVVQSANAAAAGRVGLVLPAEPPEGFVELDLISN